MGCDKCEEYQNKGLIAYYRWGIANVGLMGCEKHIAEIIKVLTNYQFKNREKK